MIDVKIMPLVTIMLEQQLVFVHQDSPETHAVRRLMNVYHHHVYTMEIVLIKSMATYAIVRALFMKESIAKYVCIGINIILENKFSCFEF